MILKNKTAYTQTLRRKDGSELGTVRPFRTITIGEQVEFDSAVWEVEGKTVEPKKSTNKGE